jgi:hypothetical protein
MSDTKSINLSRASGAFVGEWQDDQKRLTGFEPLLGYRLAGALAMESDQVRSDRFCAELPE